MNDWLAWLRYGLTVLLGSCYPAISPEKPENVIREKDPAYALYQEYRYTYDTYVYLFWDESTGAGPEEAGIMDLGGDGFSGGTWNRLEYYVDGSGPNGENFADGSGPGGENYADGSVPGGGNPADGSGLGGGNPANGQENLPAKGFPGAGGNVYGEAPSGAGDVVPGESGPGGGTPTEGENKNTVPAMAQLQDYDFLMKNFYTVHTSTTAPRDLMKAEVLLGTDMRLEKDSSIPQILIYHTHSQERYADYGPDNPGATVVEAGNYLTELLQNKGWQVIHDTTAYDIKGGKLDRSRAYNYALEGISEIVNNNPSIQVILDIHRDGVKESLHLMSEVNGKPTANIMFFQGMSRTPEALIDYLPNPNLSGNLAFTLQMQLKAARDYPGFTRKIYMKGLRYNLHLRPRSALVEVGAQTNSIQEAKNAMEPLAEILDEVLCAGSGE